MPSVPCHSEVFSRPVTSSGWPLWTERITFWPSPRRAKMVTNSVLRSAKSCVAVL